MHKFFVSVFVFFAFVSSAFSQITLKTEHCVLNRTPGYCAWCCLETLGNYHKIEALYGLVEKRSQESDFKEWDKKKKEWVKEPYVWVDYGTYFTKEHVSPGSAQAVKNKLNALKVKYRLQESGNLDKDIFRYGIHNKLGVIIVVRDWTEKTSVTHAILVQNYDEKGITFFDPNDVKSNYTATWEWVDRYWTGYAIVIEKQ